MRKKKTPLSARRGPGRPRKTTTSDQPRAKSKAKAKAAKRGPGRPRKAASAVKTAAKRVGKAARTIASAAKDTLFGKVHGLARWVPEKGDLLITKTAGAFQLGKSSWRKMKGPSLALESSQDPAGTEATLEVLEKTDEAPVKRRRGRPRKARPEDSQGVVPIKGYKKRRNVEEPVLDEIDGLNAKLRQTVSGSSEKKAQ